MAKRDPMLDEVPVVFVLPPHGDTSDSENLADQAIAACRGSLADFKVPREVHVVDELPRSTLEKIAKAKLGDRANQS